MINIWKKRIKNNKKKYNKKRLQRKIKPIQTKPTDKQDKKKIQEECKKYMTCFFHEKIMSGDFIYLSQV